jgi:capsular exopolysaccharide synthesis family protein
MGRIAEALKRAEQERASRRNGGGIATADPPSNLDYPDLNASSYDRDTSRSANHASIVDAPAPPPFAVVADPISASSVDSIVFSLHDPTSEIAEKYRSLRTRLLTSNPSGSPRSLAITSALHGEGKSVTTANLGFSLSELRYLRVALIDLDFHRRGLSRLFKVADSPGIADVLQGECTLPEVCIPLAKDNLFFIPAGRTGDARPSELLASSSVSNVFAELNTRFHYSLIDTPPVNKTADIGQIAPLCHAVVIVVRMNRTPEPLLCRCVKMLQANQISIAGCVLAGYQDNDMSLATHDYYQTS